jgi:molybdate transport system substrate-binding protein
MKATARRGAMTLLALIATAGAAAAEDIRVYCSGAPAPAAKAIAADFSAQSGHLLKFTVAPPATIVAALGAGDKIDLVILPAPTIAMLRGTGAFRAGSIVDLARVGIGVAVRQGAKLPDISSAAAIRGLLRDARAIVYSDPRTGGGSAGRAVERMIDQMGLTEIVAPKLTLSHAIDGGVDLVANGKAEVGFFNISEILPVAGVTLVGPLPTELQSYIVFDAAIPNSNTADAPAVSFIKALAAPAARPAWQKAGLEPFGAAQPQ